MICRTGPRGEARLFAPGERTGISFGRPAAWIKGVAWLLFTCAASAQTNFPFQIRVQQGPNAITVPNNSNLVVGADNPGQTTVVNITLSYRGQTSVTFTQQPELFGSPDFQITNSLAGLPITLQPTQAVTFDMQFRPATTNRVTAQLELLYTEAPPVGVPSGTSPTRAFVSLNFTGTAPDITVNYFLQPDLNILALAPGSKLVFPPTLVNGASNAVVIITNRGSGPGPVSGVNISGAAFQAQGLPLFPVTLDAGREFRFNLRYAPKQPETNTGRMQVMTGGRTLNFDLEGTAIGSNFTYEVLFDEGPRTVRPDESFSMPETAVGQRTSVAIRIRNTGTSDGPVNSLNVIGPGFQITDSPFLPQTLAPNAALVFTLTFAPQQAGEAKGRLRVGNDSFEVTARGLGPQLVYSYATGDTITQVAPGGPVIFSPLPIAAAASVEFMIRNTGTAVATIANIGIVEQRGGFSLSSLPSLPVQLASEGSLRFTITFKPTAPGFASATLRIDAVSFTISGSGDQPLPLSGYRLQGPGAVDALQQPAVSLELMSPYPIPLTGTLTISVQPDGFSADPSVQFATGGRTVGFTIAPNTTTAIFVNGSSEIRLQTGSVSGAIVLTPSFNTESGFNLTPDTPTTLRMTIPAAPPRLLNLQVTARGQNTLTLAATGVVTTRSLTRMEFRFTAAPNFNVPTTTITINLESDAGAWFRSAASQAFGGQFVIQAPFTLRSDQSSVTSPIDALQSVSMTASNELGASNPVAVDLKQ